MSSEVKSWTPNIKTIPQKKLIGKKLSMTFADNKTADLWQSFMPGRKEIKNNLTKDLFSLLVYPPSFDFNTFNAHAEFDKWAAVEVSDFDEVPNEMETFTLSEGLYAVFLYKGLSTDTAIFQYIFGTWLPASNYKLDNRPHVEILGVNYKNNDPSSEEEIWIPVKPKK